MAQPIDTVLEIDTPEHLAFRTRIAGPGRRLFAWMIDLIIRGMLVFALTMVLGAFAAAGLDGLGTGLMFLILFLLDWFYFFGFELLTGGRSPGKVALKLRVVRPNGLPITWRESFLRNLIRAADITLFPPYFLFMGPLIMAADTKFRRLGDWVAGTVVVVEDPSVITRQTAVTAQPEDVAELPGSLPLDRGDLEALELFMHREHMSDARREELAEIVAPIYAGKLQRPYPKNATAFLAALWARAQDPRRRIG